ncbi:two-component response regulator-like APRR1 [Silene latifolia]|uniref:two-component response regulator-like APRR1 n=1 Tax=Silene latifolia TaxID=37657 RepID=UPI003D77F2BF
MDVEVGPSNGEKSNDQFIDRSKVRILLCDNDSNSCLDVVSLLSNCSYQVTSVKSPRQVIDALNAEGPDIDIILSEVDLPMKKGLKLLKYIMRDKELQRIPVIMMSTQDEVSLVVKCLRLGAADFLVKPLRSNELLNLWTHMWRRRRMLGLAEKNIISYDLDPVASDPSDANTNSTTTLFSDDTDDKSRKTVNPEMSMSVQQEDVHPLLQTNKATMQPMSFFDCRPNVPGISDRRTGQVACFAKRSELKIGESSAFFTYVKSNTAKNIGQSTADVDAKSTSKKNRPAIVVVDIEGDTAQPPSVENKSKTRYEHSQNGNLRYANGDTLDSNSHGEEFPSYASVPNSTSMEFTPDRSNDDSSSQVPINGAPIDVSRLGGHGPFPYYMSGMMNHMMMPPAHLYPNEHHGHGAPSMMPHYNHFPHCTPQVPGMMPFTYYPMGMGMGMQQGHLPPYGNSPSGEARSSKVDRREAALMKFRQKRKERCFDKKIRYINRKKLAERRPRVRGQFVRKVNGVTFDLNGDPSSVDLDDEDEDEDGPTSRDLSPEDDVP